MARIFLSHSSKDNAEARALGDWLAANGWPAKDVFLDIDPETGIAPGERWQKALNDANDRCEAVIFLVSRNWLASTPCQNELSQAYKMNRRLFPVLIDQVSLAALPARLREEWQGIDLENGRDGVRFDVDLPGGKQGYATFSKQGLQTLRVGLVKAGLDSAFFEWPPHDDRLRAPYRGLAPMEPEDAGIFYGREAATIAALGELRGLAETPPPRLMAVLGASGAGKSSFMRAGLIPRLKRDDHHFLVLPVVRPQRRVLSGDTGLAASLEKAGAEAKLKWTRAQATKAIATGPEAVQAMLGELTAATMKGMALRGDATPPVVILPLDQAEELFQAEGREEAMAALDLMAELMKRGAVTLLATIRTDSYEQMQNAPALTGIRQTPFNLPALARGAYQRVIEGPAERLKDTDRKLKIDPALTEALLKDIEEGGAKDALPLLAFALERLYLEHGADGDLTLKEYDESGRISGAIEAAVKQALVATDNDPKVPRDKDARLALLRRAMIPWLAGIDPDTKSPRRQVAKFSDLPDEAKPLVHHFIEQRLLSTDRDEKGERTVEPAHEALLRQWGLIDGWLKEDIAILATLEGVRRAARDWSANARKDGWLAHGGTRLEDAETIHARPDLAKRLEPDDLAYLASCRAAESARLAKESRSARLIRMAAIAATLLALVAAGAAWWGLDRAGEAERQRDIAAEAETKARAGQLAAVVAGVRSAMDTLAEPSAPLTILGNNVGIFGVNSRADASTRHDPSLTPLWGTAYEASAKARAQPLSYDYAGGNWRMLSGPLRFSSTGRYLSVPLFREEAAVIDTTSKTEVRIPSIKKVIHDFTFNTNETYYLINTFDESHVYKSTEYWPRISLSNCPPGLSKCSSVNSASFSKKGDRVYASHSDGYVRVVDVLSGNLSATYGSGDVELHRAFTTDSERHVLMQYRSSSYEGELTRIDIIDTKDGEVVFTEKNTPDSPLTYGAVFGNSAILIYGSISVLFIGMDFSDPIFIRGIEPRYISYNMYQDSIAFIDSDNSIGILSMKTGGLSRISLTTCNQVSDVEFSGDFIAIATKDDRICLHSMATNRTVDVHRSIDASVWDLALSADGMKLAAALSNNTVLLFDPVPRETVSIGTDLSQTFVEGRSLYGIEENSISEFHSGLPQTSHPMEIRPVSMRFADSDALKIGPHEYLVAGEEECFLVNSIGLTTKHFSGPCLSYSNSIPISKDVSIQLDQSGTANLVGSDGNITARLELPDNTEVRWASFESEGKSILIVSEDGATLRYEVPEVRSTDGVQLVEATVVDAIGKDTQIGIMAGGYWTKDAGAEVVIRSDADRSVAHKLEGSVSALQIAGDVSLPLIAGLFADGKVRVWSLDASALIQIDTGTENIANLKLSPTGTHVLAATATGEVSIWRIADGIQVAAKRLNLNCAANIDVSQERARTCLTNAIMSDQIVAIETTEERMDSDNHSDSLAKSVRWELWEPDPTVWNASRDDLLAYVRTASDDASNGRYVDPRFMTCGEERGTISSRDGSSAYWARVWEANERQALAFVRTCAKMIEQAQLPDLWFDLAVASQHTPSDTADWELTDLLTKASANRNPFALHALGDVYLLGIKGKRSKDVAKRLYSIAAAEGSEPSAAVISILKLSEDPTSAACELWNLADNDNPFASAALAQYYAASPNHTSSVVFPIFNGKQAEFRYMGQEQDLRLALRFATMARSDFRKLGSQMLEAQMTSLAWRLGKSVPFNEMSVSLSKASPPKACSGTTSP